MNQSYDQLHHLQKYPINLGTHNAQLSINLIDLKTTTYSYKRKNSKQGGNGVLANNNRFTAECDEVFRVEKICKVEAKGEDMYHVGSNSFQHLEGIPQS